MIILCLVETGLSAQPIESNGQAAFQRNVDRREMEEPVDSTVSEPFFFKLDQYLSLFTPNEDRLLGMMVTGLQSRDRSTSQCDFASANCESVIRAILMDDDAISHTLVTLSGELADFYASEERQEAFASRASEAFNLQTTATMLLAVNANNRALASELFGPSLPMLSRSAATQIVFAVALNTAQRLRLKNQVSEELFARKAGWPCKPGSVE